MFNLFSIQKSETDLGGREFKEKFQTTSNAVLVDVRTPGEYRGGSINGAINIDFLSPTFQKEFLKLSKSKHYFLFCRSGGRSGQACRMLTREGYTVYNLDGGIGEWPA